VTPVVEPNSPVFKAVLDGCHEALGSFVLRDGQVFSSKLLFGNVINPQIVENKNTTDFKSANRRASFSASTKRLLYFIHLIENGEADDDERFAVVQQLFKNVLSSMQLFQVGSSLLQQRLEC
jgi:hypothetical protein